MKEGWRRRPNRTVQTNRRRRQPLYKREAPASTTVQTVGAAGCETTTAHTVGAGVNHCTNGRRRGARNNHRTHGTHRRQSRHKRLTQASTVTTHANGACTNNCRTGGAGANNCKNRICRHLYNCRIGGAGANQIQKTNGGPIIRTYGNVLHAGYPVTCAGGA
jgi:hypothetical protein